MPDLNFEIYKSGGNSLEMWNVDVGRNAQDIQMTDRLCIDFEKGTDCHISDKGNY